MQATAVASIVMWAVSFVVNAVALYLLWKRSAFQPLKSRSPLWLGISLIFAEIQVSTYFWRQPLLAECHWFRISLFLTYSGYYICLVIRCWKLHFIYNLNKAKILIGDKKWFVTNKKYINDKFLGAVVFGVTVFFVIVGIVSFDLSTDIPNKWAPYMDCIDTPYYEVYINVFVLGILLAVLLVFFFYLRKIDDGFRLSSELQVSICVMAVFAIVGLAGSIQAPAILGREGVIPSPWFMNIPVFISLVFAVYQPIYLTYTYKWRDPVPSSPTDSPRISEDIEKFEFFLNNPSGFEPYLRFLHSEFCSEFLLLWKDIDEYLRLTDDFEIKEKAQYIYEMYLDPNSYRSIVSSIANPGAPLTRTKLVQIQKEVESLMLQSFNRFKESKLYHQFIGNLAITEGLLEMGLVPGL